MHIVLQGFAGQALSSAKDAYFPFPLCFTFFGLGQGCPVLLDAKIANETLECLEEERRMPTWWIRIADHHSVVL